MRTLSVALPFHRADVMLVYGAAGILIVTLGLIASGRDQREAAARPAAPAAAASTVPWAAPVTVPGGFGVRPALAQPRYAVRRSVF